MKKGVIQDGFLFMVLIFMAALSIVIGFYSYSALNDGIQADDQIPTEDKAWMQEQVDGFPAIWDYSFLVIIVAVFLGALFLSFAVPSNPLFLILAIILVVFFGAVAGNLSNAWLEVTQGSALEASADNFPIINFIINNYMLFIVVLIMMMVIVFYAKPEARG